MSFKVPGIIPGRTWDYILYLLKTTAIGLWAWKSWLRSRRSHNNNASEIPKTATMAEVEFGRLAYSSFFSLPRLSLHRGAEHPRGNPVSRLDDGQRFHHTCG